MTKSARGATTPAAFAARERAFLRKSSFHDIGVVAASNARAPRFLCSHRPYLLEKRGKLGQIDDIRWFRGIKFGWYWRLRRARKKSIGKIPGQTDARSRFARAANYEPPIIVDLPEFKVVFPTSEVVLAAL